MDFLLYNRKIDRYLKRLYYLNAESSLNSFNFMSIYSSLFIELTVM